jgi:hypothetical protein
VLQLGLIPSHFSFLLRHIIHARRFGFGTLEFPFDSSTETAARTPPPGSDIMVVSGGVSDDDEDDIGSRDRLDASGLSL